MYRELIHQMAPKNSWAEAQPPALPADIKKAEKAVGFLFPSELKNLLSEMNGDNYLLFSVEKIIHTVKLNRQYLLDCYKDIDQHIFFAGNGCGDYYGYDIRSDGSIDSNRIILWDHETNETRFVASSITELITRYYHSEI